VHRRMYYKPDIFTYAGIYRGATSRRQRASIYEYQPGESGIRTTPALSQACELLATSRRSSSRGE